MCQTCLQNPCHPRCPNAAPRPLARCSSCRRVLCDGDSWAECADEALCEDCLSDLSAKDIVRILGGVIHG